MSLFSLDNILLDESVNSPSNVIDIDRMECLDDYTKNYSFVQEGYDFIIEMNCYYMAAEKAFFKTILESRGNDIIITESFDGFFGKIKDIIHKFIEWIKKVFKQFVVKMNSLFSSEKYIKKNSKLFAKFDSRDEFEFKGYEFTKINDVDVPKADALDAFQGDNNGEAYLDLWYDDGSQNLDMSNDSTKAARTAQTTALNNKLNKKLDELNDNVEDFYDSFRARVIGSDSKYDSSEYADELFRLFRNDYDEPTSITIDSTFVMDAYRRFDKYKDTVKSIEKTQKQIIKDYEALERHLDKMLKLNKGENNVNTLSIDTSSNTYVDTQIDVLKGNGGTGAKDGSKVYDKSTFDKMNNYMKAQSAKVNQMCAIHTQAFSAKLEAAKDCFKQDKKILYKALSQITKRSNKPNY
nr:MAG TPA: hypothetical protein [Caudoviricetes sp.]